MSVEMPPLVGVGFAHAAVQVLAEDHAIDILHIKGPAVDEKLRERIETEDPETGAKTVVTVPRASVDADVLVRPSHLARMLAVMRLHGWSTAFDFEDGSAFEHATTMAHDFLAPLDLHRSFPGIGLEPEAAFDRLWLDRHGAPIAGYPCDVPSLDGQRLLLLLHAARGGIAGSPDVRRCWTDATEGERHEVTQLAKDLKAEVALAAASGRLRDFQGHREHDLWAALSRGESSMVKIWVARVRASPTRADAARTAVRLVLPNRGRMARLLGRPPTLREVAHAYVRRARWGLSELRRLLQREDRRGL